MKAQFIAILFLLHLFLNTAMSLMHWAAFRAVGIGVERVTIFFGRPLFTFQWFGVPVDIGWWPASSCVKYDQAQYFATSRILRLSVLMLGLTPPLLLAFVVLGIPTGLHYIGTGFIQLPLGTLHPRTVAVELTRQLYSVFMQSGLNASAIFAAKFAALAFLPLGAGIVLQAVAVLFNTKEGKRWIELYYVANALCFYVLAICWLIGMISFAMTDGR